VAQNDKLLRGETRPKESDEIHCFKIKTYHSPTMMRSSGVVDIEATLSL